MNSTNLKNISLALTLLSITSIAQAAGEGFYLGGQIGRTNQHNKPAEVLISSGPDVYATITPDNTGVGERIFMGYNISQYAGIESGFTHYAPSTYHVDGACSDPSIRENGWDILGVGRYQFPMSGFALFGKAGFSYLSRGASGSITSTTFSTCGGSNNSNNSFRPMAGVGVGYDLTQNWVADVSYTRALSGGGVQNTDFVAFGISYHFVDRRCGQFLC